MFIKSIKLTKFIKRFCAEHILSYMLGYTICGRLKVNHGFIK